MRKIVLPISIGEALDKLTILDIKSEKISDSRRNDCLKEYTILLESLQSYVTQFAYHYKILKEINLTIWNLQENIHEDSKLVETYGTVLKENDRRFRVKKQINSLANSIFKEQKGYAKTKAFIYTHLGLGDHFWMNGAVRYLATCYDEVTVVVKNSNEAVVRSTYLDNPSIKFYVIHDDMELYPFSIKKEFLESQEYKVFSCGFHVTDKQPNIYEFPHSFYDDIGIPRDVRTNYFYTTEYKESTDLYKDIKEVCEDYLLVHQNSSQKKLDIYSKLQKIHKNTLILDINENHYTKGHQFHEVAKLVVNKPMVMYKDLAENAKEIHCIESSFYCFVSHLDLSKVEKKMCYEPFDNSAERVGVFQTGFLE